MQGRPFLNALRSDEADWAQGQTALAERLTAWRAEPSVSAVLTAMACFGAGSALELCHPLAELFNADGARAQDFARQFVAAGVDGLDAHPLGQLPLPHGRRDAVPTLVLARTGRASLALAVYDGAALGRLPAPKTAKFEPQETWLTVLSGSGKADMILRRDGDGPRAVLQSGRIDLTPGTTFYRYGLREAMQVRRATGGLVVLRLQRALADQESAQEYSLPDGALVHQAAARPDDTRCELVLSLLGRMNRQDALTQMARIALREADRGAGQGLRWEAVREVLSLDTRAGVDLLMRLSGGADDPLAQPAASLLASLLQNWPDLGRAEPCPE